MVMLRLIFLAWAGIRNIGYGVGHNISCIGAAGFLQNV